MSATEFVLHFQESQTDSQDEMAYLKKQVKSLTNQIQQQQQKITELRYRATSPGAVPMGAVREIFEDGFSTADLNRPRKLILVRFA